MLLTNPLPEKSCQFPETVYIHVQDINSAYHQATSPRPDVQSLILKFLLHLCTQMSLFTSSAPQDPGISLICTLRGFPSADPAYQSTKPTTTLKTDLENTKSHGKSKTLDSGTDLNKQNCTLKKCSTEESWHSH